MVITLTRVHFILQTSGYPGTLVPEVFFRREETRQERERSGERKPLVAGDANLTLMLLTIAVNQHHEID